MSFLGGRHTTPRRAPHEKQLSRVATRTKKQNSFRTSHSNPMHLGGLGHVIRRVMGVIWGSGWYSEFNGRFWGGVATLIGAA